MKIKYASAKRPVVPPAGPRDRLGCRLWTVQFLYFPRLRENGWGLIQVDGMHRVFVTKREALECANRLVSEDVLTGILNPRYRVVELIVGTSLTQAASRKTTNSKPTAKRLP